MAAHGRPESPEYAREWYAKQAHRYENNWRGLTAVIEKESGKYSRGTLDYWTRKVREEIELAAALFPPTRALEKSGYATEAAQYCVHYAFNKGCSERLVSIISPTNSPSIAVAKRIWGCTLNEQSFFQEVEAQLYQIENKDLDLMKKISVIALLASLLIGCKTENIRLDEVREAISLEETKKPFFSPLASDEMKGRDSKSGGYAKAASFVEDFFQKTQHSAFLSRLPRLAHDR